MILRPVVFKYGLTIIAILLVGTFAATPSRAFLSGNDDTIKTFNRLQHTNERIKNFSVKFDYREGGVRSVSYYRYNLKKKFILIKTYRARYIVRPQASYGKLLHDTCWQRDGNSNWGQELAEAHSYFAMRDDPETELSLKRLSKSMLTASINIPDYGFLRTTYKYSPESFRLRQIVQTEPESIARSSFSYGTAPRKLPKIKLCHRQDAIDD